MYIFAATPGLLYMRRDRLPLAGDSIGEGVMGELGAGGLVRTFEATVHDLWALGQWLYLLAE